MVGVSDALDILENHIPPEVRRLSQRGIEEFRDSLNQ
jgi:hypothetical protein